MKKIALTLLLQACLSSFALAEERTIVNVPPEIREMFLEEMRTHLDNLNEITYALSAGDFSGAAYVAENKMGVGHSIREIMMEKGVPEHEIKAFIQKMRKKHGDGEHPGQGMGRYMPAEFRELGRSFHQAAEDFAEVAKNVPEKPDVEDYQRVFSALSEVVDMCSACHSAYTIK